MGSDLGLEDQKILALADYETSDLFNEKERITLRYADAITCSDRDVDDALFAQVRSHFSEDEMVELTTLVAWENCSSKFNRALRVESQNLWKREH
ncbi:MAG: alkylhydroperoxidase family enzyme [Verrucomicrobiales bacterium]